MSFDILSDQIATDQAVKRTKKPVIAVAATATGTAVGEETWREAPTTAMRRAVDKTPPAPISLEIVSGILRAFDAVAVLGAGLAALLLAAPDLAMPTSYYVALSLFGALAAMNTLHLAGSYKPALLRQRRVAWPQILLAWGGSSVAMALAILVSGGAGSEQNWVWMALWFTIGLFLPVLARAFLALRMDYWSKAGRLRRRIAILGTGPAGQQLLRKISSSQDVDAMVVGLYDDRPAQAAAGWRGHAVRGNCEDLVEDIRRQRIDMVLITGAQARGRGLDDVIARLRCVAVDVCLVPDVESLHAVPGKGAEQFCGIPLLPVERRRFRDWQGVLKNVEDRVFAACIVLLISPLLAGIAVAIRLDSPGPIIFRQKRYGLNNQLIEVLKFRTMYHHKSDPNATQLTRRNDPRVTRVGAFLRRTSLDELPQFFNVLFGDMSVVGPRPHATLCKAGGVLYQDAVENYDWRHRVKPGITGWAQVNGWRGETETVEQIRKRVEHDIYYIENWSLLLDIQIILRTIFGGFTGTKAY
jgi:Undecaprenyl-phosphate glucose phosphotransferase